MTNKEVKRLAELTEKYTTTYKEVFLFDPSAPIISFSQLVKIVSVYNRKKPIIKTE